MEHTVTNLHIPLVQFILSLNFESSLVKYLINIPGTGNDDRLSISQAGTQNSLYILLYQRELCALPRESNPCLFDRH